MHPASLLAHDRPAPVAFFAKLTCFDVRSFAKRAGRIGNLAKFGMVCKVAKIFSQSFGVKCLVTDSVQNGGMICVSLLRLILVAAVVSLFGLPASVGAQTGVARCVSTGALRDVCRSKGALSDFVAPPISGARQEFTTLGDLGALVETLSNTLTGNDGLVADPNRAVLSLASTQCQRAGGRPIHDHTVPSKLTDLDGDGRGDVVINWLAIPCSAQPPPFCGKNGCLHSIFIAQATGFYREVFRGPIRGLRPDGRGMVDLYLQGADCAADGSDRCHQRVRVGQRALLAVE